VLHNAFRFFLCFCVTMTYSFSTYAVPEQKMIDQSVEQWNKMQSLDQFLDVAKPNIRPDIFAFLKEKVQTFGLAKMKMPKLTKKGDKTFTIEFMGTVVLLEIGSLADGTFSVNHHEISLKKGESNESYWNNIKAALPAQDKTSLMDILIPPAYAILPYIIAALAVATFIAVMALGHSVTCGNLDEMRNRCEEANVDLEKAKNRNEKLTYDYYARYLKVKNDLAAAKDSFLTSLFQCENGQRIKSCIDELQSGLQELYSPTGTGGPTGPPNGGIR
jgi:hypothetical protein